MNSFKIIMMALLMCLSTSIVHGQISDPELRKEIDLIKLNLGNHHKQYKTGTNMLVAGILTSVGGYGISLIANGNNNKGPAEKTIKSLVTITSVVGSGLILVGSIIQIDSHKHFKKAALGLGSDGLTLKVKL